MSSKRLWAMPIAFFALSVLIPRFPGVWAQEDMAACPEGWEWNENSLKQDPCVIASILDATCRSYGQYTVPPLHSGQEYSPPSKNSTYDLVCDCDTVMYSLYMACSTCQGGDIYPWINWISQCDNVYIAQYPHDTPHGTAIPRWAFYNITSLPNQTYNDTLAMSIGRDPEATPKPLSTLTVGSSTSTSSARPSTLSLHSSSSSTSYPTQTNVVSGKNNTAVIVGGVVGGVVPLIILGVVVAFFFGRRARGRGTQETQEYYKGQPTSPTLTATSANLPYTGHHQNIYGTHGQYGGMPEL